MDQREGPRPPALCSKDPFSPHPPGSAWIINKGLQALFPEELGQCQVAAVIELLHTCPEGNALDADLDEGKAVCRISCTLTVFSRPSTEPSHR